MKAIGIWMDREKAHIITTSEEGEEMTTVFSEIEEYHIHGGSGTRLKGGPQDVVQDSKYLERENHQFRNYFKKLIPYIREVDKIALFGPAEAAKRFQRELHKNYRELSEKIDGLVTADSMTENQTKELVRNYFKKYPRSNV